MATITKKINKEVQSVKHYQFWLSTENNDEGNPIAQGDHFMIEDSLGRPARTILLEVDPGYNDLLIRLNSRVVRYPLRPVSNSLENRTLDLENPYYYWDETMDPIVIESGNSWSLSEAIPVSDITLVSFDNVYFKLTVM